MPPSRRVRTPDGPSDDERRRWMRAANGIAAIVVGFVVFGLGVGYGLGLLEVVAALVIAGGAVTLLRAVLADPRR